ncbi:hypothetical protein [Sphingobacterium multivorum]|uniref:hypothetical protein n=1 Tax=Sphingobacterium multivorum TaxID=28454 RepID=UPI002899BF3F|nr:hypothetical protein [Sphingobacterium multivorum]
MGGKLILQFSLLFGQLFLGESCTHNSHRVTAVNTKNEITAVSISMVGGFTVTPSKGYTMKITRDSIYCLFSAIDTAQTTLKSYVNTEDKWNLLLDKIDLEKFIAAKEEESRQPYDGIDIKISITTKKGQYVKLNADDNPSWNRVYKQLEEYFPPQAYGNKKLDN